MSLPQVVSRQDWLAARKELLRQEKELTRQRDALNADRRRLPMVRVDKEYVFDGPAGPASLVDLFDGRRQLVLQHFMFDPSWDAGCPSCTGSLHELSAGLLAHLNSRDTSFAVVARAPLAKIEAYKASQGWTFPFYSSHGSDFNYDFHTTLDESVAPVMFNYRDRDELIQAGFESLTEPDGYPSEQPGYSFFLRATADGEHGADDENNTVFHTYSTFGRGCEDLGCASYYYLDHTALGRQENWEEPSGRVTDPHDAIPVFT